MRILYLQHFNPAAFPPLLHSSRILAEHGWEVFFLGVYSEGSMAMGFPQHRGICHEVLPYTPPGPRQKLAYLGFMRRAVQIVRTWKPEWVYVSDTLATPVAWVLAKMGCKVVYHEHDLPEIAARPSGFMRMTLAARRAIARRAEFNIVPQQERCELFIAATGTKRPVHCVWNCPPRHEAGAAGVRERKGNEPLGVYFHGSVNLDQVPLSLLEGAALCDFPVVVRVVGYETIGSRGTLQRLREAADMLDGNLSLDVRGTVSRHELAAQMNGMHVGWMNSVNRHGDVNVVHRVGASNKAFEYLASGLPLLVPEAPSWNAMYVEPGYARACDAGNPQAIAAALHWFHDHPEVAARMGVAGRARIEAEWNYETQFESVRAELEQRTPTVARND